MGLGDIAGDIGSALSSGAGTIGVLPTRAAEFAKGIATKAESFVEERADNIGTKAVEIGGKLIGAGLGVVPSILSPIADAVMDPVGFVEGIVTKAQSMASSALEFAESVVPSLANAALTGIRNIFSAGLKAAQIVAKSLVTGLSAHIQALVRGVYGELEVLRSLGIRLLTFEGKIAKNRLRQIAQARIVQVQRLQARMQLIVAKATIAATNITHKSIAFAQQKMLGMAMKIHLKATKVATQVLPKILAITTKVMVTAISANAKVQSAIDKAKKVLPNAFAGPLNRISRFTNGITQKAIKLQMIYAGTIMPALLQAYGSLEAHLWPLLAQGLQFTNQLELSALSQISEQSARANLLFGNLSMQLQMLIGELNQRADREIDSRILKIDRGSKSLLDKSGTVAVGIAKGVGDFVEGIVEKGMPMAGPHASEAGKGAAAGEAGKAGAQEGGVGAKAAEAGKAIGGKILGGIGSMRIPQEGDFTGPFFPSNPALNKAAADHLPPDNDPDACRAQLKKGAFVFINGRDASLHDHLVAAQKLADAMGRVVVGIFNPSGGKKLDPIKSVPHHVHPHKIAPVTPAVAGSGAPWVKPKPVGDIDALMAQPRLTPDQIAVARGLIAAVTDVNRRGDLYEQLDTKTAYLSQRQNWTPATKEEAKGNSWLRTKHNGVLTAGDIMCNLTSLAMVLETLGIKNPDPAEYPHYPDYLEHVRVANKLPARTAGTGWMGVAEKMGARGHFVASQVMADKPWWEQHVRPLFRAGKAVMGSVRGHIVRLQGVTESGLTVDDPFGMITLGVDKHGKTGKTKWKYGANQNTVEGKGWNRGEDSVWKWPDVAKQQIPWIAAFEPISQPTKLPAVQRSATGPAPEHDARKVKAQLDQSGDQGFAPDTMVRQALAPLLGFDPAGARLHTGPAAAAAAGDLQAKAFTIGEDVYFGEGNFSPHSPAGMALIGHELTHVAQQTGAGSVQRFSAVGSSGDAMEAEAQTVASRIMQNLGDPSGFRVQHFNKTYEAAEGVGREDARRLDRIGELAVARAQAELKTKNGHIDEVFVSIELDLGRMSDEEAARIWAEAIIAQVRQSNIVPLPTVPAPQRIQRDDKTTKERHLPKDIERSIEEDVAAVSRELRAWMTDWAKIQGIFHRWAMLDIDTMGRYDSDTKHMDYFLVRLQITTWDKGVVSTQFTTALDELLRGNAGFWRYLKASKKYESYKPGDVAESAGSYVGRHVLVGVLGIIKALGAALMGLGQAGLWVQWKAWAGPLGSMQRRSAALGLEGIQKVSGVDLNETIKLLRADEPPKMDEYVAKQFDELGKILVDCFDIDAEEKKAMLADFNFGAKWGAIPANLMLLGAGGGGLTGKGAQAVLKTLMIVQSVKGIDDAMKAMGARVEEMREKAANEKPPRELSWTDIISDGEMLKQFATVIVSAIALGTSMAEADQKAKGLLELLKKAGYAGDWGMLGPLFKKAWDDYHADAATEEEKSKRKDKLEQDAIDIINQIINIGNSTKGRHEEHQKEQQRIADEKAKQQQAEQERLGKAYESNKREEAAKAKTAEPSAEEMVLAASPRPPARSPYKEQRLAEGLPVDAEAAKTLVSPSEHDIWLRRKATAESAGMPFTEPEPPLPRRASMPEDDLPPGTPEPEARAPRDPVAEAGSVATKRTELESEIKRCQDRLSEADAEGRSKLEKRMNKLKRKLAELGAPGLGAESKNDLAAIAGGDIDRAVAMIQREKAWKGKLRESFGEGGEFEKLAREQATWNGVFDEAQYKTLVEKFGNTIQDARAKIVDAAKEKVRPKYPDIEFGEPGTPGFTSDRDITARPNEKAMARLEAITDPAEKMKAVAALVEQSGNVVAEMNKALTEATGGIPDKTLDTNMYSWTGAEVKFPAGETQATDRARKVASLAEVRRSMEGNPQAWDSFKKSILEGTEGWEGIGGDRMRAEAELQLARADQVTNDLALRTKKELDALNKAKPHEARAALAMEARAKVAAALSAELAAAMRLNPPPYDKIASLQSQVKMVEPGAYASQAGIEDVVGTQQPKARMADDIFKAREALDDALARNAMPWEVQKAEAQLRQLDDAQWQALKTQPKMGPAEIAQSAASTLAQMESHDPSKHGDHPMTDAEAETAVKDASKYGGRVAYLEATRTGNPVEAPDVANFSRKQLRDLVAQWATETGRNPERPFNELAAEYAAARLAWARSIVANLAVEALAAPPASVGATKDSKKP